ncbi:MAG TPA: tetratricopeptide repeat protein [Methylomirabilota bacterium]|nr:tetratricopeptide repeat protein [Methylomirabilota bacterium]
MTRRFLPAALVLVTFATFRSALGGQFLDWDDYLNLVQNEAYRGLGWPQVRWAFTSTLMGHYIPLTWLTFSANYAAGALDPWGYHLVNLLLHSANALAFYLVARRLLAAAQSGGQQTGRDETVTLWGAAAAALIFAVHPLRVESVAWITERRDVLSGLFLLLAVLAYLKAVEASDGAAGRWRVVSLVSFAAGLLSKSSIMVLPAVLVLLDHYPLRRGALTWRRLVVEKAGYWALGAVGAVGALIALRLSGLRITTYGVYGPAARLAMVAYSLWFYPSSWLWPVHLSPLYELPATVDPWAWRFLGPVGGLAAITVPLWLLRKRWPSGLAAWIGSALFVLPVSGVVHAGFQLAHDRYSYLSGLGFALLSGGAITWLLRACRERRLSRPVVAAALASAVLVIAALGVGSWQQARIWRDPETLWRWALEVDPRCAVCANNLAAVLSNMPSRNAARMAEAEALARRAMALRPTYDSPYNTLGAILADRRDDRGADAAFREAMRLGPDRVGPAANLGALYARAGRHAEALPWLRKAWARDPGFPGLRSNLGSALRDHGIVQARAGRLDEAVALFREAAGIIPDDPDVHRNLGLALWEQGRSEAASPHLERAVALRPSDESTQRLLVQLRADPGHPPSFR